MNESQSDLEYKMQLAVVCALLTTSGMIDQVSLILQPEMFSNPALRLIYTAAYQLYQKGVEIDVFTVEREMAVIDGKKFEEMHGIAFVNEGMLTVRDGHNALHYAREVKRLYLLKRISGLAQDIAMKASTYEADVQGLLSEIDSGMLQIAEEATAGSPTKSVAELADESLAELRLRLDPDYHNNRVQSGFFEYDYITGGFYPGELTICGGRPSSGKTEVALWMALNAARASKQVLFFSLEMSEKQMMNRFWTALTSVHPDHLRMDSFTAADLKELEQARQLFDSLPIQLEYTASLSLEEIRSKVMLAYRQGKCDLVVIDYLHMLRSSSEGNETQATIVGRQVNELKNLSVRANVPILCLAQMNRNVEHRADKLHLSEMSDLRDSGVIEQTADTVIFVHRSDRITSPAADSDDGVAGVAKLDVKKNRNGGIGMARFRFNETFTKLWNYGQALPL